MSSPGNLGRRCVPAPGFDVGSVVQGNKIGVDVDGLERLPNVGRHLAWWDQRGCSSAGRRRPRATSSPRTGMPQADSDQASTSSTKRLGTRSRATSSASVPTDETWAIRWTGIFCCGLITDSTGERHRRVPRGPGTSSPSTALKGIRRVRQPLAFTGPRVSILGNSIYSNYLPRYRPRVPTGRRRMIRRRACPSAPGDDCDTGPNDFQNFPVIGAVTSGGGQTVATTSFNSTPDTEFRLEFFRNTSCNKPPPSLLVVLRPGSDSGRHRST